MMSETKLAGMIDHTLLAAEATEEQIDEVVRDAIEYSFASVCVNPCYIARVSDGLNGKTVGTCSVVGFPFGANAVENKVTEGIFAVTHGANEIDFVAHIPHLLACDYDAAVREFGTVVEAVRQIRKDVIIKVIIESALLMKNIDKNMAERRIDVACRAALEAGCDFIKTSTGFHAAGGATVKAVRLMKKYGRGLMIKASGGIRSYSDAVRMIEAGADRLGCSASVAIINETPE